jgi:hypothetical protein
MTNLINLDLSAIVIEQMQARYHTPGSVHYRPGMKFLQGDASALCATFGANSMDVIVDKGTVHSVLLLRGGTKLCNELAQDIYGALAPGGRFVLVAGVQPGLAQYLRSPELRWRVSFKTIVPGGGGTRGKNHSSEANGRAIYIFTFIKPRD